MAGPQTGQLTATSAPVFGAYSYNWRVALKSAPNVFVREVQTTAASNTFEGLTAWSGLLRPAQRRRFRRPERLERRRRNDGDVGRRSRDVRISPTSSFLSAST